MLDQDTVKILADLSLTMFSKNFFGIYHGAISTKQDEHSFMINTRDAIFDRMDEKSSSRTSTFSKSRKNKKMGGCL
mgnify:CR=1 FL=1